MSTVDCSHDNVPRIAEPFGEYFVRVLMLPPSIVADLAATCATLYLYRSDPAELESLSRLWARLALREMAGVEHAPSRQHSSDSHTPPPSALREPRRSDPELAIIPAIEVIASSPAALGSGFPAALPPPSPPPSAASASPAVSPSGMGRRRAGSFDMSSAAWTDDTLVTHFLSTLQQCIESYFSYHWDAADALMTINHEHKVYVERELIPRCERWRSSRPPTPREPAAHSTASTAASSEAAPAHPIGPPDGEDGDEEEAPTRAGTALSIFDEVIDSAPTTEVFAVPSHVAWASEGTLPELRARAADCGLVLYFHAGFSEPSCKTMQMMADLFAHDLKDADSARAALEEPSLSPSPAATPSSSLGPGYAMAPTPSEFSLPVSPVAHAAVELPPQYRPPLLAVVNAPSELRLATSYHVTWFPTIVYIPPNPKGADGAREASAATDHHRTYPESSIRQRRYLLQWICRGGDGPVHMRRFKSNITKLVLLDKRMRFAENRELKSAALRLEKMQCRTSAPPPEHTVDDPPVIVFLGGGMAAGKTTAAAALSKTAWWKRHGSCAVIVDADEFKLYDPLFHANSPDLHARSTKAAEELLVDAVNAGRDIVFDGTMSWLPHVQQTVEMVRRAHLATFRRSAVGYAPEKGLEEYWEEVGPRATPLPAPYLIRLIGITVDPVQAVQRGILRRMNTGRAVPVRAQLRSFRLFAHGWPVFCQLCDSAVLYDNNVRVDLEAGELPMRIAEKRLGEAGVTVHMREAYEAFLRHTHLNQDADAACHVWSSRAPPPDWETEDLGRLHTSPLEGFEGPPNHANTPPPSPAARLVPLD